VPRTSVSASEATPAGPAPTADAAPTTDPASTIGAGAARRSLTAELTGLLVGIGTELRHRMEADCLRLGLSPAVARALLELDPHRPLPARDLASRLSCDRSNVVGLVDKLEEAGLVRRQVEPADRRVKTLVVTDAGRRVQAELRRLMDESGAHLDATGLTEAELGTLRGLCARLAVTL
jgi:DNA-binding MarR family transcriptional regulator